MGTQEGSFNHYLQTVEQRTQALHSNIQEVLWEQPQLVLDCLQELQNALEELQIAEYELRQQNEELLLTRQEVEQERQRYRDLFEFAPDGYVVTDVYGIVREANQVVSSLFNIHQKHLIGKPLIAFVIEEQRRPFRSLLNQLTTMNRVQEWEVRLCGRDGEPFDAALTVETVRTPDGQLVDLRWLLRDVTARKQAEERLRQIQLQNLELLESDRLKSQFISTLSHELRTPLNAILGFSQLLLRRLYQHPDSQLLNLVEPVFRNGKHLLNMIEEMLDFSSLQARRMDLRTESFNLPDLIHETVNELRVLVDQEALVLQVYTPNPDLCMVSDRKRLRQVLVNLISNAIKFTDTGSIEISTLESSDKQLVIQVRDTGIGIAPEDLPRIFREFWQANQTSCRHYGGTGLGLAIAKALVDLMQGRISVTSRLGEGSTFRVELPHRISWIL